MQIIIAIGEQRTSLQGFQSIISSWNCMNGLHGLLQSFGPNDISITLKTPQRVHSRLNYFKPQDCVLDGWEGTTASMNSTAR
jgi:hypothetical protein